MQKSVNHKKRKPIPELTVIRLWVRAGGRCQVCNEYLLIDVLTLKEANYSNIAHIVAVSRDGPRGHDPMPLEERNNISNLMLVCPTHHKLIDSKEYVGEYTTATLRKMKCEHETRIHALTGYAPENKTSILRMRANFDPHPIDPIATPEIEEAIAPKYMADSRGIEIDLTQMSFTTTPDYWAACAREIGSRVRKAFEPSVSAPAICSVSVFALAPIPLLALLGNALGPTVPIELYQRHVDTDRWRWKDEDACARLLPHPDPRRIGYRGGGPTERERADRREHHSGGTGRYARLRTHHRQRRAREMPHQDPRGS